MSATKSIGSWVLHHLSRPWFDFFAGVVVYAAGIVALACLPAGPPPQLSISPAWRARFPVLLTSLAINPLMNTISPPFVIQYISKRYSIPISTSTAIQTWAPFVGMLVAFTLWGIRHKITYGTASVGTRDFQLACLCLVVEIGACWSMSTNLTQPHFKFALITAFIGSQYSLFTRSFLISRTDEGDRLVLFAFDDFFQVAGKALTGWGLERLFKQEIEGNSDSRGLVFRAVTICPLAALFFLAFYFY